MLGIEGRSSIFEYLLFGLFKTGRVLRGASPGASKLKAPLDGCKTGCYFLPRLICLDGPNVWPLTPLAICWISPPDLRNKAI